MSPHAQNESDEGPIGRWPRREVAASSESKRGVTSPGLGVYKVNEAEITRYHEDNGGKGKTGSPPKGAPGVRGNQRPTWPRVLEEERRENEGRKWKADAAFRAVVGDNRKYDVQGEWNKM